MQHIHVWAPPLICWNTQWKISTSTVDIYSYNSQVQLRLPFSTPRHWLWQLPKTVRWSDACTHHSLGVKRQRSNLIENVKASPQVLFVPHIAQSDLVQFIIPENNGQTTFFNSTGCYLFHVSCSELCVPEQNMLYTLYQDRIRTGD